MSTKINSTTYFERNKQLFIEAEKLEKNIKREIRASIYNKIKSPSIEMQQEEKKSESSFLKKLNILNF